MHDSHKIRTLLACIDDLTKAVQDMSAEASIHQADQDLLLYRSRLFYEAVLCMPTAAAVAPETPAPAMEGKQTEAASPASVVSAFTESIEHSIEVAVEHAVSQHEEVEVDLSFETTVEPQISPVEEVQTLSEAAPALVDEGMEEAEVTAEQEVAEETATFEVPTTESVTDAAADEELPATPIPSVVEKAPAAKVAVKSVAFSLTGIIERSGDSHLVMAHLKLKPIDDLKSGIGLNEKFLFIRELFGNDHLAYAEAIEKLNAAPSLESAEAILASEVLPQQQWDLETEAALSFLHLIFRRFAQP